jgi:hypothetical protein
VDCARIGKRPVAPYPIGKSDKQKRRWQRESDPGGKRPCPSAPRKAQGHPDLAARGAGQELTEGDKIRVAAVVKPSAALDELRAEVTEVSNGAAEGREAQSQEREQDLDDASSQGRFAD